MKFTIILFFVFISFNLNAHGSTILDSVKIVAPDSAIIRQNDTLKVKKKGFINKVLDYFNNSNKVKRNKKFDVSFIGGPYYTSDIKFGLGLVGVGQYHLNGCDSTLQPSSVSLFGNVSTVGFVMIGLNNITFFPNDNYRLKAGINIYSFPTYYWGIGYENGNNNDNKTKYKRIQAKMHAEFLFKVFTNLYIGPGLCWDFIKGNDIKTNEHLFEGQNVTLRNYGIGFDIEYDSRDFVSNAYKGMYFKLSQTFRPKFLKNDYAFSQTAIEASLYHKVWNGGILAYQVCGDFNYGNPSWAMLAKIDGSKSMRGYYDGRYRDKYMITGQIELRQHIWRRNGIVVWVGGGSVFHNKDTFKHFLPNYGLGYRWEFKKRVNIRLDYGFGKSGQSSFIFNINEAF